MGVETIYSIRAAEGKADELLGMLLQGRDFAKSVEGCEGFEVYQGRHDPHNLVMVEHWSSVEAHRAHFAQNVRGSGVLDAAEALMTRPLPPPEESYFELR
jgi:quinol monooxygenase YgiN